MAQTLKVLGQAAPTATTEMALYTVPASTTAAISTVFVCNRGGASTTFRVYIAVGGAGTANNQYLYYDQPISANSSFPITVGLSLAATDVLRVFAGNGNLSFSAFGVENA